MKVCLSADIEGTCGITDWRETERSTPFDYSDFRKQMTLEVAAACEGAIAVGAEEVFVRDAHDSARNIDANQLPEATRIMRGWTGDPLSMMSGLDRDIFDAVFFTGYHAWAACGGNPLSHTMNRRNEYVTLNGVRMSEFMFNAYTAGYYGVPVSFLSGDKPLCDFAKELIPNITTVPVNQGIGGAVISMHPAKAVKAIREGAEYALKNAKACPVILPDRFDTCIRFRDPGIAYSKCFYPGAKLEDEKNVLFSSDDWFEMIRFYHFVLSD